MENENEIELTLHRKAKFKNTICISEPFRIIASLQYLLYLLFCNLLSRTLES